MKKIFIILSIIVLVSSCTFIDEEKYSVVSNYYTIYQSQFKKMDGGNQYYYILTNNINGAYVKAVYVTLDNLDINDPDYWKVFPSRVYESNYSGNSYNDFTYEIADYDDGTSEVQVIITPESSTLKPFNTDQKMYIRLDYFEETNN